MMLLIGTLIFLCSYLISFTVILVRYLKEKESKETKKYLILFGISLIGAALIFLGTDLLQRNTNNYSLFIFGSNLLIASRIIYFTSIQSKFLEKKNSLRIQTLSPFLLIVPITLYFLDQSITKLMLYHAIIMFFIHSLLFLLLFFRSEGKERKSFLSINIVIALIYFLRASSILVYNVFDETMLESSINIIGLFLTSCVPVILLISLKR